MPCPAAGRPRCDYSEIGLAGAIIWREDHQRYLHKNPGGYCGLRGTGVACPAEGAALQPLDNLADGTYPADRLGITQKGVMGHLLPHLVFLSIS